MCIRLTSGLGDFMGIAKLYELVLIGKKVQICDGNPWDIGEEGTLVDVPCLLIDAYVIYLKGGKRIETKNRRDFEVVS